MLVLKSLGRSSGAAQCLSPLRPPTKCYSMLCSWLTLVLRDTWEVLCCEPRPTTICPGLETPILATAYARLGAT